MPRGAFPLRSTVRGLAQSPRAVAGGIHAGRGAVHCGSAHPSARYVRGRSLRRTLEEVQCSSLQCPWGFVLATELPSLREREGAPAARDVGPAIFPSLTFLSLPRGADSGCPELPARHIQRLRRSSCHLLHPAAF